MAKYFIRADGMFAGIGIDGAVPEEAFKEVPTSPEDGRQRWNGKTWEYPAAIAREVVNGPIIEHIESLETRHIRRSRELLVKLAAQLLPADDPDRLAIESVEGAIAAERGKLAP